MDLLNIDQSGSKLNKPNKSNEKMKSSLAGEAVCVVGDVEFWKADAENVSLLGNYIIFLKGCPLNVGISSLHWDLEISLGKTRQVSTHLLMRRRYHM